MAVVLEWAQDVGNRQLKKGIALLAGWWAGRMRVGLRSFEGEAQTRIFLVDWYEGDRRSMGHGSEFYIVPGWRAWRMGPVRDLWGGV